ncbi:DNA uptake protein ComE [Psychroflexus salarius]|uniref:DNA uptake protein ComE n=1 Tax=Psychroflexus salarius TaxID=1155689 RepID=A0A1M4X232_9FLAO|nr:helix-hairpin-helix domain-containing protein [Psychroflexus salarius]SHE87413.1 DNA uptake protein ComE [Psychroflexus salarius]
MKPQKSQLVWTTSDRVGIFALLILIGGLITGVYFAKQSKNSSDFTIDEPAHQNILQIVDSLKNKQNQQKSFKIYPFNPNFITDYKAYSLKMPTEAFDKLQAYRNKGQWINSKADFKKVTGVSDDWMKTYSGYFKFPDWVIEQQQKQIDHQKLAEKELSFDEKKDLNLANIEDLIKIKGVGDYYAKKIIQRRERLNGFRGDVQLKDVYGLSYEVENEIMKYYTVKTSTKNKLIDINTASIIQLQQIPYFDYELARKIFNFIKLREGISSFDELNKIKDFPTYKIPQLKLYLNIQ